MASKKVQFIVLVVIFFQLLDSTTTAPQFFGFGETTTVATVADGSPTTTTKASGGFFGIPIPVIALPNITSILDAVVPKPKSFWEKISDQCVILFDIVKMEVLQIFLSKALPK